MPEHMLRICYVKGKQSMPANYLSKSVGEGSAEKHDENKRVIERIFCKHEKEEWETAKIFVSTDSNSDLEKSTEIIKDVLFSEDSTRTPAFLRRHGETYQIKCRYIFRQNDTIWKMI